MKKIYNDPQIQLMTMATESAIMGASSVAAGGLGDNVEYGGSTGSGGIGTADSRRLWDNWD